MIRITRQEYTEAQIRQKHHEDITAVHRRLGHMDAQGRIRTFRGKPFFEEIAKLGHSTGMLEACECWQKHRRDLTRP